MLLICTHAQTQSIVNGAVILGCADWENPRAGIVKEYAPTMTSQMEVHGTVNLVMAANRGGRDIVGQRKSGRYDDFNVRPREMAMEGWHERLDEVDLQAKSTGSGGCNLAPFKYGQTWESITHVALLWITFFNNGTTDIEAFNSDSAARLHDGLPSGATTCFILR